MNTVPLEDQIVKYNDLISNHLKEIPGRMFTFEITKCCNYSSLVFLYKEDKLMDLYFQVAKHFGCKNLVSLYILDPEGQKILVPLNSNTTLKEFILEYAHSSERILKPVYDVPLPVVYRIYFDDGHHHDHLHVHL
jgi:hypothetical protein